MLELEFSEFMKYVDEISFYFGDTKKKLHYLEESGHFTLYIKSQDDWEYFTVVDIESIKQFGEQYEVSREQAILDFKRSILSDAIPLKEKSVDVQGLPEELQKDLDAGEDVVIEAKDYADFLRIRFQKWQTDVFKFLDETLKDELIEKDYVEKTFGEFVRGVFNSINTHGFRKGLGAIIRLTFKEGIKEAEKELGVDIGFDIDFKTKVRVVEEQQVDGYFTADGKWDGIKGISQEAQKDILNIVHKGLADREGLKEVKKNIKTKMDQLVGTDSTDGRAMRIARTESNRMISSSKLMSYKKSGLKGKKRWNAFHDNRTSDVCKALNGQVIGLDELFTYKDGAWQHPPAKPNCRSVLEFVIDTE